MTNMCAGSGEEVRWLAVVNQPRCAVCLQFVNYNVIEEADGFLQDSLINLFCEFISEEKASGITLEQFARFMFTQTTHGITSEYE